jgi:hypothetical protein
MTGEGLDSGVLERKPFRTEGAHKLNRTDARRVLGEDEIASHGAFPRLDGAQDRVA